MPRKTPKKASGEQLDLIDVLPKTAQPIVDATRIYKEYQAKRLKWLAKEKEQKKVVLQMIKDASFQVLEGGVIKFCHDGAEVSTTPRDELLKLKEL